MFATTKKTIVADVGNAGCSRHIWGIASTSPGARAWNKDGKVLIAGSGWTRRQAFIQAR